MRNISDKTVEKTLSGLASKKDAAKVALWLETAEGQLFLSEHIKNELHSIKAGTEEILAPHPIPSQEMLQKISQAIRRQQPQRATISWWRVAAILLPFILLIGFALHVNRYADIFHTAQEKTIDIKRGEKLQLMLHDGSSVYANSDSKIMFPTKFGLKDRTIHLEGEAYFDIEKSHNRPFIVQLEKSKIVVLGTRFNVKAYPDEENIYITLDNGSITFESDFDNEKTLMKPGEALSFNKKSGISKLVAANDNNASAWTAHKIVFRNEPFDQIVRSLQRRYNIAFRVEDARAYNYSFTFSSEENIGIDAILADFERVSPLRFTQQNKEIIVSIKH